MHVRKLRFLSSCQNMYGWHTGILGRMTHVTIDSCYELRISKSNFSRIGSYKNTLLLLNLVWP